jgi:hypothetical protein
MMRLPRHRYSKGLVPVLLLVWVLFAFSGQALASPLSSTAAQPGNPPTFTCVPKPVVQAPPLRDPQPGMQSVAAPPQAACPNGQVPQPTAYSSAKQQPYVPAPAETPHRAGYHYVSGLQTVTALGAEAGLSQHAPFLADGDSHTLAEIAAMSADTGQIVEIGWTVDRGLNGDSNPHLFVFSWVNRIPNCYNGCGYVQYSSSLRPGMAVSSDGSAPLYAIESWQGNWWLWYATQWIGYFPGSIWSSKGVTFTTAGLLDYFGEVFLGRTATAATQMGDGTFGSNAGSAVINNPTLITTSLTTTHAALTVNATDPDCYNFAYIPDQGSFGYGGPGCPPNPGATTYTGSYSPLASGLSNPLTLQIVQSGQTLSGTANDNGTVGSLSGSIDSSGTYTIFLPSGRILSGSLVGPGHLSGTYTNGAGEIGFWDATSG